jgi:two-component system, NtrC family, response regulator HydG
MSRESTANILLIEDDIDVADSIIAFFRQKDISVTHISDPILALKEVQKNAIDLVITDLNLPHMSGLDFLKSLRADGSQIPVILITATSGVETAFECIEAGAYDYVVKPLQFQQLNISVHRALHAKQMSQENTDLKKAVEVSRGLNPDGVIGFSPAFRRVFDLAKRVSQSTATVLIMGESGSGKEVFAKAIHQWGPRKDKPFVAINCSAIPDNLLESELFGHAKGSLPALMRKKLECLRKQKEEPFS